MLGRCLREQATWLLLTTLLLFAAHVTTPVAAQAPGYVQITTPSGESGLVPDNRKPALYTQTFGDCLGSSLLNVTRFDAAYYQDNMTVLFHLEGNSNVANESVMMYIGVFAYGESRFDLTFDPCNAQIFSLCPMNRSLPISADGIIPVSQNDVAGIPPVALSIPDFEGQAVLRIFGNSTQTEIGCYTATITNGASFSHPNAVGTVLGIFTLVAVVSSFATTVYGDHLPTMRTHYAHSLSVFIVFAIFHHIFFTGALSVNWPSVLAAWWSNFAWAGGMIYSEPMQNSINHFLGTNKGNISIVGAASTGPSADGIGGGYQLSQIYKRSASEIYKRWTGSPEDVAQKLRQRSLESYIAKRSTGSDTVSSPWFGQPVKPGLPIPGNFSGFAGTLADEKIPASNAFMTGFLWLLILIVIIAGSIAAFKGTLEFLDRKTKYLRTKRLDYFRAHWKEYILQAVQRIFFISFFMMMFLCMFQFTFSGKGGAVAIAALVFVAILVGVPYLAFATCYERLRFGRYEIRPNRAHVVHARKFGALPWIDFELESRRAQRSSPRPTLFSLPIKSVHYINDKVQLTEVHEDQDFIRRRGWLASRFRRTRWWFFAAWIFYEFVRACFYGGAAGHSMTQVFGLLVVECIAFVFVVAMRPFEGARLNALMVYLLGFSKVATVALSAAFDPRFGLARIQTTAIGIVIIVIQGILTAFLMIAIVVGAISTYFSLTRNWEDFKPKSWLELREKYLIHVDKSAKDIKPAPAPVPEKPKAPYFSVNSVTRQNKIEDEDDDLTSVTFDPHASLTSVPHPFATTRSSRTNSVAYTHANHSSTNLPFGARSIRHGSWSIKDSDSVFHAGSGSHSRALSSPRLSAAIGLHPGNRPDSRGGTGHGSSVLNHKGSDNSLRRHAPSLTIPEHFSDDLLPLPPPLPPLAAPPSPPAPHPPAHQHLPSPLHEISNAETKASFETTEPPPGLDFGLAQEPEQAPEPEITPAPSVPRTMDSPSGGPERGESKQKKRRSKRTSTRSSSVQRTQRAAERFSLE